MSAIHLYSYLTYESYPPMAESLYEEGHQRATTKSYIHISPTRVIHLWPNLCTRKATRGPLPRVRRVMMELAIAASVLPAIKILKSYFQLVKCLVNK